VSHPFITVTTDQRTDEWFAARAGCLTGSRASDMLATIKSGEAAARRNLRTQLVLERLVGAQNLSDAAFNTPAMQQGTDREPEAVKLYAERTGQEVLATGFLRHRELAAGGSPDGYVGDFDGVIEVKCPTPAIHLVNLRSGTVPTAYGFQVLHNLWITGARWADFISYNPNFPENLRLKIVRVPRNEAAIASYEKQAREFLAEVDTEYETLRRMAA
jgi:predicted phage-related endonuclease